VLIQNEDLIDEFYEILEDEDIDEAGQEKLERKYAKETEVIRRDDRLDTIAKDIVDHFPSRGYLGKGMVITLENVIRCSTRSWITPSRGSSLRPEFLFRTRLLGTKTLSEN